MPYRNIFIVGGLATLCSTAVLAADASPPQERAGGITALVRTVAYLPFKGVVCLAGIVSTPAAYVGSGLDPQVKEDAAAIKSHYCSAGYLLSSQWEQEE